MMRNRRICACFLSAVLAAGAWAGIPEYTVKATSTQDQIDDVESRIAGYQEEIDKTQDYLDSMNAKKDDIEAYIEELTSSLEEIRAEINDVSTQVAEQQQAIADARDQLEAANAEVSEQYDEMKLRIRYMYETGDADYISMILSAGSLTEMLQEIEYIRDLSSYDKEMLDRYKQTCADAEAYEKELEGKQEELLALQENCDAKKESLQMLLDAEQAEITELTSTMSASDSKLAEYKALLAGSEEQKEDLEGQLETEMAAAVEKAQQLALAKAAEAEAARVKAAEEEAAKAAAAEQAAAEEQKKQQEAAAAQTAASGTASSSETAAQETAAADTSSAGASDSSTSTASADFVFVWPVPCSHTISSYFGPRPNLPVEGVNPYHNAIDIAAPEGSEIVAAADGYVIHSGDGHAMDSDSGGNQVWISSDGGRYITSYMHCSKLLVSEGEYVTAGTVIALVGSTGASTGNHLDFRIIENGAYVDPLGSRVTYVN